MLNQVSQTFNQSGQIAIPAGINSVTVTTKAINPAFDQLVTYGGLLDPTGKLWGWGWNGSGGIGNNGIASTSSPVAVVGGLTFAKFWKGFITGSTNINSHSTFGLTTNGNIYGWGSNVAGILGNGTSTTAFSSPVLVVGGLSFSNMFLASGQIENASCSIFGITPGGQLYSWGPNISGSIGNGTSTTSFSSPVLVAGGLTFATAYNFGEYIFGITPGGQLYSWGLNQNGELGDGTVIMKSSPVLVLGGLTFAQVITPSAGFGTSIFGITPAGQIYGWGINTKGTLGDGTSINRSSPVLVLGGLTAKQFIAPFDSSGNGAILTAGGQLYSWGNNSRGTVGNGTTSSYSSPVLVAGGLLFTSIFNPAAIGGSNAQFNAISTHVFGVTSAGQLYGWGNNAFGQLGDGTVSSRSSPVLVVGGLNFNQMKQFASLFNNTSAGFTNYALMNNGQLYAWGDNSAGSIGDGTTSSRSSPVLVAGGLSFSYLTIFETNSTIPGNIPIGGIIAVTNQGLTYSWGSQPYGDCGTNVGTAIISSPVLISGGLAPSLVPATQSFQIPVQGGTTYQINMGQLYSFFGTQIIGQQQLGQVTVQYAY